MSDKFRVDTRGLERAQVLVALVNGTNARGAGLFDPNSRADLTYDIAREIVEERRLGTFEMEFDRYYFDYVGGRPLKLDLNDPDSFDPQLYDRDAGGHGSAENLIKRLRFKIRRQGG